MLIRELSSVGDTVANIVCGSGTTLLEALGLKRHAVGVDANPLAAMLVSKAKTTLHSSGFESLALHQLASRRLAASSEPNTRNLGHKRSRFKSRGWRPASNVCQNWFEPFVVEELAELKSVVSQVSDESGTNVCSVTLAAIVVSVSLQDSDTRYVRRKKQIAPGDIVRKYLRQLVAATSPIGKLSGVAKPRISCGRGDSQCP